MGRNAGRGVTTTATEKWIRTMTDSMEVRRLLRVEAEECYEAGPCFAPDAVARELVATLGVVCKPSPRPKGMRKLMDTRCAYNSYTRLDRNPGYIYTEGFARYRNSGRFVPHAWCITSDLVVVDSTWPSPEASIYIGIPMDVHAMNEVFKLELNYLIQLLLPHVVESALKSADWQDALPKRVEALMHPDFVSVVP